VPGLCTAWKASPDFRRWTFRCRFAAPIAAALRRVKRLDGAPDRHLFADATVNAPSATTLVVKLSYPWRRFPYALTVVGAAPRFVPGPFRLVSGTARLVVAKREGTRLEFRRLPPLAAVREFRRGALDEAPVPLGDIVASKADPQLGPAMRARTLLGLDVVDLAGYGQRLRQVYWQTADRGDYEQLIPELAGSGAYGFLGGEQADPAAFRRAVDAIPTLTRLSVPLGVPPDRTLRYGARLLYAQWRDVGLGPRLVSGRKAAAGIRRVFGEIVPSGTREAFLEALGQERQRTALMRLDEQLRNRASVIPIAWVVDARLVSPRLEGWREDVLGNVDYSGVRSLASSRRP
jgi:hypothetical protein